MEHWFTDILRAQRRSEGDVPPDDHLGLLEMRFEKNTNRR